MNKKKSKCTINEYNLIYLIKNEWKKWIPTFFIGCCIYEKPKTFDESSSEDSDDECEHCHGHKDAHKKAIPNKMDTPQEEEDPLQPGKYFIFMFLKLSQLNGNLFPRAHIQWSCVDE